MPDSPASDASHDSENDQDGSSNPNKGPAVKDKECQYCHQKFTSSSLGRHLDQFISKKKPDGIHNVDAIRKARGAITRRTVRGTGGKKDHEEDNSTRGSPTPKPAEVTARVLVDDKVVKRLPAGGDLTFNKLNWQATGVITDPAALNASPTTIRNVNPEVPVTGTKRNFSTYAQDLNTSSTGPSEHARALELALREVLDSLRAANKNASPKPSPFSFHVQSQTFPSLCLLVLPPPATLFQSSPFSTLQSIPISAPGPDQMAPLRQKLTVTIDEWKWDSLRLAQPTTSNIADEADFLAHSAQQFTESTLSHLETAYQNWMIHPYEVRNALWCVELLRAYKSEQDRNNTLEDRFERLQQETNQLQQQVEYLSKCQWPREMALYPPKRRTFDKAMREELRLLNLTRKSGRSGSVPRERRASSSSDGSPDSRGETGIASKSDKWNFDALVNKWKAHVREDRGRRGGAGSSSLPVTQALNHNISSARSSIDDVNASEMRKTQSENRTTGPGNANPGSMAPASGPTGSSMRDALNSNLNHAGRPSSAAAVVSHAHRQTPITLYHQTSSSGDDGNETDEQNRSGHEGDQDPIRDRDKDQRKTSKQSGPANAQTGGRSSVAMKGAGQKGGPRPMKVQIISDW